MDDKGAVSALALDALKGRLDQILRVDFSGEERKAISGELTGLVADMLQQGRERNEPIREVFGRLGDKWSVLLLLLLRVGVFRHATLRRLVSATSAEGEISQRMLTLRLRVLERDGLITRTISNDVPPRVDYAISPMGLSLLSEIDRLMAWVKANNAAIRDSQLAFDAREPDRHGSIL